MGHRAPRCRNATVTTAQKSWSTRRRMFANMTTESAAMPASLRVGDAECLTLCANSITFLATPRIASLSLPANESSTYRMRRCFVPQVVRPRRRGDARGGRRRNGSAPRAPRPIGCPRRGSPASWWRSGTADAARPAPRQPSASPSWRVVTTPQRAPRGTGPPPADPARVARGPKKVSSKSRRACQQPEQSFFNQYDLKVAKLRHGRSR